MKIKILYSVVLIIMLLILQVNSDINATKRERIKLKGILLEDGIKYETKNAIIIVKKNDVINLCKSNIIKSSNQKKIYRDFIFSLKNLKLTETIKIHNECMNFSSNKSISANFDCTKPHEKYASVMHYISIELLKKGKANVINKNNNKQEDYIFINYLSNGYEYINIEFENGDSIIGTLISLKW